MRSEERAHDQHMAVLADSGTDSYAETRERERKRGGLGERDRERRLFQKKKKRKKFLPEEGARAKEPR